MHEVLDALLGLNVKGIHVISGETDSLMIFRTQIKRVPDIIDKLNSLGVGVVSGIIDVLEVKATIPPLESLTAKEESKIQSKVPVEEIYKELVTNSELTYKFVIFSLLAGLLAGFGLIYNNSVVIIAAMVLAPLLGPILALSYAYVVNDRNLIKLALKAEVIGFIIALACGLVLGAFFKWVIPYLNVEIKPYIDFTFIRTLPEEILVRGEAEYVPVNIIYAFIMGIAVGFSLTEGIAQNVIGIAIGASILPPIVNVGICLAIGEFEMSGVSALLFLINFLVITATSIVIFKLKNVRAPIRTYFLWRGPRLPKEKVEEEPPSVVSKIFGRFRRKKPEEKSIVKKKVRKEKTEPKKAAKPEPPKIEVDIKSEIKEVVKEALKEEIKKEPTDEKAKKKAEKDIKKEIQKEVKKAVKEAMKEEVKKIPEKVEEAPKIEKEVIKEALKEAIKEEAQMDAKIKTEKVEEPPKIEKEVIKEALKEAIKEEIKKEPVNEKDKTPSIEKEVIKEALKEALKEESEKDSDKNDKKKEKK